MQERKSKKSFWLTTNGIAAIIFISAAGYFLIIEHREHLFQWLPWLILLLCPFLHIFMHGGHGHGDDSDSHDYSKHKHDE